MLYKKIYDHVKSLINNDPKITKLPSERQLQERFNSTRITVREALVRLETDGVIYRLNRKGWFVNETRIRWDPIKKANFYSLAVEQGVVPKTHLLVVANVQGEENIRYAFSLEEHEQLLMIHRLRFLDSRPVMLEAIYCRESDFPDLRAHSLEGSLTQVFKDEYGIEVTHEKSNISISALKATDAKLLEQSDGAPCLRMYRRRYNKEGQIVDFNVEHWVPGAIELEVSSL